MYIHPMYMYICMCIYTVYAYVYVYVYVYVYGYMCTDICVLSRLVNGLQPRATYDDSQVLSSRVACHITSLAVGSSPAFDLNQYKISPSTVRSACSTQVQGWQWQMLHSGLAEMSSLLLVGSKQAVDSRKLPGP